MTTDAVSGDRDDASAGDRPESRRPDDGSRRPDGQGSGDPEANDPALHPRPTSRRGRADARRRTPPPSPAYARSATDGGHLAPSSRSADVRPPPPARATGARRASSSLAADYVTRGSQVDGTGRARTTDRAGAAGAAAGVAGRVPAGTAASPTDRADASSHPRSPDETRPAARKVRRRRAVLLAGIGVLTVAGTALALVGLSEVRTSTAGRYEETLGPTDPGYQAYVVPTPTMGVLHRAADGTLAGAALLALESGDDGGSVTLVPPATIVSDATGDTTVADVYRDEGAAASAEALGIAVAVGVADHVEVDDAQWSQLVGPVGPVEFTLDAPVGEWEAGRVALDADEVGRFLSARADGETDLDRVERQELFWNAWLPLVGEEGAGALPGEVGTGIGRFVLGVARGGGSAAELPVRRYESGESVLFRPDGSRLGEFVSLTVPYPVAAVPGGRIRVRLLDGTDDPGLRAAFARALVASSAQISIVGNATSFDVAETSFVYFGEDRAPLAEWLRENIGGGRVEETPNGQDGQVSSDDEIDVTVILGQDAEDLIGEVEDP